MALISAQALHLRPLSVPPPSSSSFNYWSSTLAPLKPPAHPIFRIHAPKPARQVSIRRVVPKATVSEYSSTIVNILGDVSIFTAAGEPVKFEDLWDQNEVEIIFKISISDLLVLVGILLIAVCAIVVKIVMSFLSDAWRPGRPFWVWKAFAV